jgi:hypothetical protein
LKIQSEQNKTDEYIPIELDKPPGNKICERTEKQILQHKPNECPDQGRPQKDGLCMQSWNKLDCLQWGGGEEFACPRSRSGYVRGT